MIEKLSEEEIVKGLFEEDSEIINRVYTTYESTAMHVILNNNGSKEDAETIFHDALIALIENIRNGKFRGESKVSTYLTGIIKFKWLNELRKRKDTNHKLENTLGGIKLIEDDTDNEQYEIDIETLENCFKILKEDCRKLLNGYYYKKKKLKDLARELDYTEAFVRVKKVRCLKTLKNAFKVK